MRIVCIGDLMVDVLARLPGPLAVGSDTPAPISYLGGGAAANVAAWAVVAGAEASFVGRVGADPLGRQAVDDLRAAGVDVRVGVDADRPTGTCIVLVDPSGERTMVPSAGANDVPVEIGSLPDDADWLYVSGYALLATSRRPGASAALRLARERGWSIAVDAGSAAPLDAVGGDTFLGWLGTGLLLLANTDEAAVLTGLSDPAAAVRALAGRVGQAVVKCGADGAVWSDGRSTTTAAAPAVIVVDTTGAGDAFAAGFLAGAGDAEQRLANAVRLAAAAVSRPGARP